MKTAFALAAALAALLTASLTAGSALAAAGPKLTIRHAAMNVVIEPENRPDIEVDVYRPNSQLPLDVQHFGSDVVIDGHLVDWLTHCHGSGAGLRVSVLGKGDYSAAQMPQVQVHVPMNAVIDAGGVVHGVVTRSQSLDLQAAGCGDWTVANVAGALSVNLSGVGDVRTGSAQSAEVNLSGAGHLRLGQVMQQLSAHLSGTGSMNVLQSGGADISTSGAGSFDGGPVNGPLSARLSGTGSVKVASVAGAVTTDVSGVGAVDIRGGHATSLQADVSGTGHIQFDGVADSLNAEVSGVGSVNVAKVTGSVVQHVSGIGSVHVGT